MEREASPMMGQVGSVPALYQEVNGDFAARARRLLEDGELLSLRRLVFTGCGDSCCAAQIGALLLARFTGLPCTCRPSIDLAWWDDPSLFAREDGGAGLIGISVSGEVTRVAEALERMKRRQGAAIALTGNPDSAAGRSATHILHAAIPPFEFAPGVRSYCASVLMLTHLAISWGEALGTLPAERARELRDEIAALPSLLRTALPRMLQESRAVAELLRGCAAYEFIGAGLSYFSGWFGMAKILETLGAPASACNSEDWFHMQYFIKDLSGTSTCVLTHGTDFTAQREEELLFHAKAMGRAVWAVTDRDDLTLCPCIHIPKLSHPLLLPLVEPLPLAAVASELCDLLGEQYMRGAEGPWAPCAGCALISHGNLRVPRDSSNENL